MKKLLNTLYITTETAYVALDGENVVVKDGEKQIGRLPIHTIDGIIIFSYVGASPALMGKCAEMNKFLVFLKPSGRFLAKVTGKAYGNILLRKEQYRVCDDSKRSLDIARNMISAKISNSSAVISRTVRDHPMRINQAQFEQTVKSLQKAKVAAYQADSAEVLRGLEGESASQYFALFEDMILQQKDDFDFAGDLVDRRWIIRMRFFHLHTASSHPCVSAHWKLLGSIHMREFSIQNVRVVVRWH